MGVPACGERPDREEASLGILPKLIGPLSADVEGGDVAPVVGVGEVGKEGNEVGEAIGHPVSRVLCHLLVGEPDCRVDVHKGLTALRQVAVLLGGDTGVVYGAELGTGID